MTRQPTAVGIRQLIKKESMNMATAKKAAKKVVAKKVAAPNVAAEVKALREAVQNLKKAGAALIAATGGVRKFLRSNPGVRSVAQSVVAAAGAIERKLTPPTSTIQSGS